MLKKLVAVLIATLFSFSVAGLSFAAEEKKQGATPATPATPAKPAANPCATGKEEMKTEKKAKKKTAKKKTKKEETKKEEKKGATPATPATPPEKK